MLTLIRKWRCLAGIGGIGCLLLVAGGCGQGEGNATQYELPAASASGALTENGYLEWLANERSNQDENQALADGAITIPAQAYSGVADAADVRQQAGALYWEGGEQSWVEWRVTIPEAGYYHVGTVYEPMSERPADIVVGLQINGDYPFHEAKNIKLKKAYQHSQYPFRADSNGNQIRPRSILAEGWLAAWLADFSVDVEPLRFYLPAGDQTIRLTGGSEPILLQALVIQPPEQKIGYSAPDPQLVKREGWIQIVQAEDVQRISNTSIQLVSYDDAAIVPPTGGKILYNTLGGEQFKQNGQWAEWQLTVPEAGYYEIGLKYLQAYLNHFYAYRTLTIDGEIPFAELANVGFPYNSNWQNFRFHDESGEAMLFYLEEGPHTIRLTANSAAVAPIYQGLLRSMEAISDLEYAIRKVTGNFDRSSGAGNVDLNRDWDLVKYIPDLDEQLAAIIADLNYQANRMAAISLATTDTENSFRMAARDLARLRSKPREIPNRLDTFTKLQTNLGSWLFRLQDQPLLIDYLWVAQQGTEIAGASPSLLGKIGHSTMSFLRTFTEDYDYRRKASNAIEVWVNRGRDYADLIQRLADETFTQETGVTVNVNLVPDPNMFILGNAANIQPDVALGLDHVMPVDFAIRGSMLDLSQFDDYEAVAAQFRPGQTEIFHYNGGQYALPENQNFSILAYRTDILQALELKPPDTWQDVYEMVPTLQQHGYNFYLNPKDHVPFMLQNGASYYTADKMESALHTNEAMRGFQQWTELFTLYQLPKDLPGFFTHFRLGNIPIGIIDFNFYLQIQFAAPEIAGKWAIAPLPGTRDEAGTIQRWAGGAMQAGVIFRKTSEKEKAWAFLKWWVSDEIQARFGNEMEALYGPEYRWNTANRTAFESLPWPKDDLAVIEAQLQWYKEIPQVPGGYFTGRALDFAWNDTVIANKKQRAALERAWIDINREMYRKQIEFGLREGERPR